MRVKICGLTSADAVRRAAEAGAAYIGLNFFAPSPRSVTLEQAVVLAEAAPTGVTKVALAVDPDDALVASLSALPIDMIQLHGSESPERVVEVKAMSGLPVMKVIGIRVAEDLALIDAHRNADQILVDAKPPKDAVLPGGNGLSFDWRLIAERDWPCPWMLAGGLTPENVAEAIRMTGANQVDVASGVESAPGIKDPKKMAAFIVAAGASVPA